MSTGSPRSDDTVKEVTLPPENIRLFKVLMKTKIFDITELPCSIVCDEEHGKVNLAGDDDFITDIATNISQIAYEMVSCEVSQEGGFLCTAKGELWIAEEFEKVGLPAITYTKDQVTYLLTKDESHFDSVTTRFNQIVITQMITFDDAILPCLKSLKWNKTVENFHANFMVQVINDFKSSRILVRGRKEDVDAVMASIKILLHNENSELSQHLPLTHQHPSQPDEASAQPKVIVVKGDIATFAADALVNTIALKTNRLKDAGAVSESFFKAGRETLQKEFEEAGAPVKFGTDVTVTGPAGTIRAKKIFHVTMLHMRNEKSLELLTALIKTCLKKAEEEKLTSIAFPTLGCGNLKFKQTDVSRCFAAAAKGSRLQIYIVAYTKDLYEKFKNDFKAQEPTDFGTSTSCDAALVRQKMPPAVAPKADVKSYINPPPTVKTDTKKMPPAVLPKADAKSYINPPPTVKTDTKEIMSIVHPSIAQLNNEVAAKIQSLQSGEVQVAIDVSESTITLTGSKDKLVGVKQRILKELTEDELLQRNLSYIKKHKGVKEYLIALCSMPTLKIPEYWSTSSGQDVTNTSESKRLPLVKGCQVYNAVELLIKDTWSSSEGDITNDVNVSGINVTNIWIVVNQNLFRNYQFKLKVFALRAADRPFKSIPDLGAPEIITKTVIGTDLISEQLVSEVNEVYLCHGTGHVNEIEKTGIDSRFCSDFGFFGKGAYFAESSTKANQYANPISGQSTTEAKRYMFVARVLLGEPFLCQNVDEKLRRAPCCFGCKDSCTADHPMCDSVVGTKLTFREFIVYHPDQSYPEFLVEYERQ